MLFAALNARLGKACLGGLRLGQKTPPQTKLAAIGGLASAHRDELRHDGQRSVERSPECPPEHLASGERASGDSLCSIVAAIRARSASSLATCWKDNLLELERWSWGSFGLPQEEIRQRLDVPSPPPSLQRRIGSLRDRRGQAACLEQRLRDAIADNELFVMPGVTHQRPPVSGRSPEEIPFLERAADTSIWR